MVKTKTLALSLVVLICVVAFVLMWINGIENKRDIESQAKKECSDAGLDYFGIFDYYSDSETSVGLCVSKEGYLVPITFKHRAMFICKDC